jgi:hypothetical protein
MTKNVANIQIDIMNFITLFYTPFIHVRNVWLMRLAVVLEDVNHIGISAE